jgi:hypothetical protein
MEIARIAVLQLKKVEAAVECLGIANVAEEVEQMRGEAEAVWEALKSAEVAHGNAQWCASQSGALNCVVMWAVAR